MRIGLDIRSLQSRQKFQGGGFYTTNLLEALTKIEGDYEWHYFQQSGSKPQISYHAAATNITIDVLPRMPGGERFSTIPDQLLMPYAIWKKRIDVFHVMTINTLTWRVPCKRVVTVYDVLPLVYPEIFMKTGIKHRLFYQFLKSADKIIAISEYTKKEITRLIGISPEKIQVIYPGLHRRFTKCQEPQRTIEIQKKFSINRPYLLYVGDLSSSMDNFRKNTNILLDVLKLLLAKYGNTIQLVLAGRTGEYSNALKQQAKTEGLEPNVIFTGFVEDDDLPVLYSGAKACIYPSRYEGFGLPVLESMACGTPLVTTNATSIPEVAGDAALLVNPDDTTALFTQTIRILEDTTLANRMARRGIEQASRFSWESAAKQTMDLYESLHV